MPRFLSRSARSWKIGPVEVFRSADAVFHDVQQFLQVRRIAAGADQRADFAVERDQAHAVLLMQHQVGQRRGRALGVFQLRHRRRVALVAHALAGVQQQVADQVRLFLELLQVVLVGAAEDLPIEIAEVVAGRVLAVLGELDREAVERAAMHARRRSPRRSAARAAASLAAGRASADRDSWVEAVRASIRAILVIAAIVSAFISQRPAGSFASAGAVAVASTSRSAGG